jgi:hypothetical protein
MVGWAGGWLGAGLATGAGVRRRCDGGCLGCGGGAAPGCRGGGAALCQSARLPASDPGLRDGGGTSPAAGTPPAGAAGGWPRRGGGPWRQDGASLPGFTGSTGGTFDPPAFSAGRIGTTSPTEPDQCGVCGVWLERDRDGSAGLPPCGAAGPSPDRAGPDSVTSCASNTPRQFWFGQRIRCPR